MKIKSSLRISITVFIISLATTFILCSIPGRAHADDSFDDFVGFLEEVDGYMPGGTSLDSVLPVTIADIKASGNYIRCLANAGGDLYETAMCMEDDAQEALPEELEIVVNIYLKFSSGDYLGLAGVLISPDVACAVLQWIAGGTNVCALLEALAEVAEAMYDAAKAVYEFLKDVGGAIVGAYCDTIGLGCDDDSVPLFVIVYNTDFHPHVSWGVTHGREYEDPAVFNQALKNLKDIALAKADDWADKGPNLNNLRRAMYSQNNVDKAARIYVANVNTQWTNRIANRYEGERRATLGTFSLNELLLLSLNNVSSITLWRPGLVIRDIIVDRLKNNYNYGHIDTWKVTDVGADNNVFKSTVPTNREVSDSFYQSNEAKFARLTEEHVIETSSCYNFSGDIICNATDDYQLCLNLLAPFASINSIKTCGMDTRVLGEEAQKKMAAKFRAEGSTYYDSEIKMTVNQVQGIADLKKVGSVGKTSLVQLPSTEPLDFIIYRPIHESHFNRFYRDLFGESPQKLLKAVLQEDPAYKQLRETYVPAAVQKLNDAFQSVFGPYRVSATDPLLVDAPAPQMYDAAMEASLTYDGFGNFTFSREPQQLMNPVDGLSSPVMDVDADKPQTSPLDGLALQEEFIIRDPGEIQRIDAASILTGRTGLQEKNMLEEDRISRLDPKGLSADSSKRVIRAPIVANQQLAGSTATSQTMSHQVQGGLELPGSKPKLSKTDDKSVLSQSTMKITPITPVLADLQLDDTVLVAGKKSRWGSTTTIRDNEGGCDADITYALINAGEAATGSFSTRWLIPPGSRPVTRAPLQAGARRNESETLDLKLGDNRFTFMIDSSNQIRETDENNNRYNISIRLSGSCGSEKKQLSPAKPSVHTAPPAQTIQIPTKPANEKGATKTIPDRIKPGPAPTREPTSPRNLKLPESN